MTTSMRRAAMTIFFSIGAVVFRLSIAGKNFFSRYRLENEEREKASGWIYLPEGVRRINATYYFELLRK